MFLVFLFFFKNVHRTSYFLQLKSMFSGLIKENYYFIVCFIQLSYQINFTSAQNEEINFGNKWHGCIFPPELSCIGKLHRDSGISCMIMIQHRDQR